MKYCGQCGLETGDEAAFCRSCGSPFPQPQDDLTAAINSGSESAQASCVTPNEAIIKNNFSPDKPQSPLTGLNSSPASLSSSPPKTEFSRRGSKFKLLFGSILALILIAGGFWGWQNYGTEARAQAKLELGIKYLSENDYEKAVLAFDDAIKIAPKEVKGYQGLAKTYTLQGKYDDARVVYERGGTAVKPEYQIVLRLSMAGMYIDKGDLPQAQAFFQEIINGDRTCIDAYTGLSLVYQQLGSKDKALAILEQCIKENSQDYRAYNSLAKYYADNSDKERALQNLVKSLDLQVNQQDAYSILETIYQGKWLELLNQSGSITGAKTASMVRFYAYYSDKKYAEALSQYRSNLEQDPANLKGRILSAICLVNYGDKTAAQSLIKQVTEQKLNAWLMVDIARYYRALDDKQEAIAWCNKSLAVEGQNLEAFRLLVEIYGQANPEIVKLARFRMVVYEWKPVVVVSHNVDSLINSGSSGEAIAPSQEQSTNKPADNPPKSNSEAAAKQYNHALDSDLRNAIRDGKTTRAIELIKSGADPTNEERILDSHYSAVSLAIRNHYMDVVKAILAAGVDVNKRYAGNATALMFAVTEGDPQITRLIISEGADLNAKNVSGWTALMLGSSWGTTDNIKVLLTAGADVNARDNDGKTALTMARQYKHSDIVELLVQNGASE